MVAVVPIFAALFIGLLIAPVAAGKELHQPIGRPFRSSLTLRAPPQQ
jgi:hypothetical protein